MVVSLVVAQRVCLEFGLDEFVAIEVDESDFPVLNLIFQSNVMQKEFGVALMARTLADDNRCGVKPKECFGGGSDELRVRRNRLSRNKFDEIWLQKNRFASDIQIKKPKAFIG